jgi:hypothetical protein
MGSHLTQEDDLMKKASVLAMVLVPVLVALANADILWDNNVITNGGNGRAMSPPAFPDIRLAEDFVVPSGQRWSIEDVHANVIEDSTFRSGDVAGLWIYADNSGQPGEVIYQSVSTFTKMATGDSYFGRTDYEYWLEDFEPVELGGGTYWMGFRNPQGTGSGTNYWMTSDGGPDGMDSSPGWFSLDGARTWQAEGSAWHHAFVITGVPEPSGAVLLGLSAALGLARRRRP